MTTGRKLALGAIVIAAATTYLALAGASASWQYYLSVDECVEQSAEIVGSQLRVHGRVGVNTLKIDRAKRQASFVLTGERSSLNVLYHGTLPDNLTEEMEVVVEGKLERQDLVRGHKLMTKCASKYTSQGSS